MLRTGLPEARYSRFSRAMFSNCWLRLRCWPSTWTGAFAMRCSLTDQLTCFANSLRSLGTEARSHIHRCLDWGRTRQRWATCGRPRREPATVRTDQELLVNHAPSLTLFALLVVGAPAQGRSEG